MHTGINLFQQFNKDLATTSDKVEHNQLEEVRMIPSKLKLLEMK